MTSTTILIHDDTRFFEQALQEYREAVGDYSGFLDLCVEMQHKILERAQQLKDNEVRRVSVPNCRLDSDSRNQEDSSLKKSA